MKKTTLVVGYDSEKLNALRLYLKQKDQTLEIEISKAVDSLYTRTVPQGVRDFIEMQAASQSIRSVTRPKKTTAPAEADVPETVSAEVTGNA
jgi:hypothetical protein